MQKKVEKPFLHLTYYISVKSGRAKLFDKNVLKW